MTIDLSTDDISVPYTRNRGDGYAYCDVCGTNVGQIGCGDELGHSLTACLIRIQEAPPKETR